MEREDYMGLFYSEAYELVQLISDCLLRVDSGRAEMADIDELFRGAHSLKGMAAAVEFNSVAVLTHRMEDIFDCFRRGTEPTSELVALLLAAINRVEYLIDRGGNDEDQDADTQQVLEQLERAHNDLAGRADAKAEKSETFALSGSVGSTSPGARDDERFHEVSPRSNLPLTGGASPQSSGFRRMYQINVKIDPESPMKTVRAIVLAEQLREFGDVIELRPNPDDLEEGAFDGCFDVVLSGPEDMDSVEDYVRSLPEVHEASVSAFEAVPFVAPSKSPDKPAESMGKAQSGESEAAGQAGPSPDRGSNRERYIRIETERLDLLLNMIGELVTTRTRVVEATAQFQAHGPLRETVEELDHVTTELQNSVMKLRMVSVEQVFARFPRVVRSLAAEINKRVQLNIEAGDAELDRTIANRIGDLLVHLVRNAVDHGIEQPEARVAAGKDSSGTITLSARHEGGQVVIVVEDDGRGLDRDKLVATGIRKGILSPGRASSLSEEAAYQLIFAPGFSTSAEVTSVSGRGVGMDAVKKGVEELKGTIELKSKPGSGMSVVLRLPLTLAIMTALLVELDREVYAVPLEAVYRNLAVSASQIHTIHGRPVLQYQGDVVPLTRPFRQWLGPEGDEPASVIVVEFQGRRLGLVVDHIRGQQEVVIKSLGEMLRNVAGVSGSTVLGNGQVALILDIQGLVQANHRSRLVIGGEPVGNSAHHG